MLSEANISSGIQKTTFVGIGFGCLYAAQKAGKAIVTAINESKSAKFFKISISEPPLIDPLSGAACCLIYTLIDTVANRIFEYLLKAKAHRPEAILARTIISLAATTFISTITGLVAKPAACLGLLLTCLVVHALVYKLLQTIDEAWYKRPPIRFQNIDLESF